MNVRRIITALGVGLIFGGFSLLWWAIDWKVALGVFMMLWGHGIEKHHTEGCD